ncbi:hypothetical protein [Nostoc sphaeroides]|uniref:Uncharacterized protein n=1 Tax=Nostoc sphaeroides CCNUC1 TaxID=2653204 RepID=A0A5P8WI99_9NOSO|nr:hypothetical protein [Nostoc sphaeroides]QFS52320.1 hypothetical protein GXM_09814 [Nostoc sphaeroides CCNUC1]
MQHLRDLLKKKDDSLIAWLLWNRLHEIEAFLKEAQAKFPEDPEAKTCDAVLQDIQSLLELPSPDSPTNQSQNTVTTPTEDSGLKDSQSIKSEEVKLSPLRKAFNSDKNLIKYLGDFQLRSETDSDLWKEIQHKLLRLPKEMARSWRELALELAKDAQAEIDTSNIFPLRFTDNEEIYPGLKGSVEVKGLYLSKSQDAFLEDVLQENKYEGLSKDLKLLACLVSICIYSIKKEPDLYHALETVNKFDAISLHSNTDERKKYIDALKERFQRTIKAEESGESLTILKAWINIDEAINSLVFMPPADSDSWCGELQKKSRRILIEKAKQAKENGYDVRIQQLSGVYADLHNLSSGYDLRSNFGGIPGEVQTCLRVYARINQEELKGRVIYRSLK